MRLSKITGYWIVGALFVSAAVALGSQPQRGQGRPGPGLRGGHGGGPMAILRELDLTEEQRASMRALFEQARETGARERLMEAKRALEEAVESGEADEGAVRELAYGVGMAEADAAIERIQMRAQIRSLLTSEQLQKLDELEAERKQRREEMRARFEERRQQRRP